MKVARSTFIVLIIPVCGLFSWGESLDEEGLCPYEKPEVEVDYWPVLAVDPIAAEKSELAVVDVFVDKQGIPSGNAIVSAGDDKNRPLLREMARSLRFKPARACGEFVDGFYRYPVKSYFFPVEYQEGSLDSLPVPRFSVPASLLGALQSAVFYMEDKDFEFTFTINEKGKASRLKGKKGRDRVLAQLAIDEVIRSVNFDPAMRDGSPVKVEMGMKINLSEVVPKVFDKDSIARPMPARPEIGQYTEGKEYAVLLDFYANGGVSDVQFLTIMNEAEAWAALGAFRKWRTERLPDDARGGKQLKVAFTYADDEESAILLNVEKSDFILTPKPLKIKSPVFPNSMQRRGKPGAVKLSFVVQEDGHASSFEVMHSTHKDFTDASVTAIKNSTFEPGTVDGVPVKMRVQVTIPFEFNR